MPPPPEGRPWPRKRAGPGACVATAVYHVRCVSCHARAPRQAFFAQIYSEAQASRAAPGHYALAEIHELGRMRRHYTLNIDGLAEVVGMDTWHHERNPGGVTVEMHGDIR